MEPERLVHICESALQCKNVGRALARLSFGVAVLFAWEASKALSQIQRSLHFQVHPT